MGEGKVFVLVGRTPILSTMQLTISLVNIRRKFDWIETTVTHFERKHASKLHLISIAVEDLCLITSRTSVSKHLHFPSP